MPQCIPSDLSNNTVKLCFNTHGACETHALLDRACQTRLLSSPSCAQVLQPFGTLPCSDHLIQQTWASCHWVEQLALLSCYFTPLQDTIFRYTSKADVLKVELEEAEWLYGVPAAEALEDPVRVRTVSRCCAAQACRVTALHLCSRGSGGSCAMKLGVSLLAMSR